MREEVLKAALAGLLHDVGKLGRLAGEGGRERYAHAAIGDRFVNAYVPERWRDAMAPVGWHHGEREGGRLVRPVEEMWLPVKLVALADRLSSGERESHQEDTPRTKQLLSVFGRVDISKDRRTDDGKRPWVARSYFAPAKLELRRDVMFPTGSPTEDTDRRLGELWEGLKGDAAILKSAYDSAEADLGAYLESIFHLLRDYTWCVPAAYVKSEPDVSLFAHLHTTAALAACLAHSVHVAGTLKESDIDRLLAGIKGEIWPDSPAIAGLLKGDISGIQGFIYSLHNPEGAAASLRARSAYLQILTETIARWILRELGLPITNALYIGGGGFTLLVPPLGEETLVELRRRINAVLSRAHGIALYLGLAYVELVPRDFSLSEKVKPTLGEKREELGRRLDEVKARRFAELELDKLVGVFEPRGFGGEAAEAVARFVTCQVCGNEVAKGKVQEIDGVRFCPSCMAFVDLGRRLRGAEYLFLAELDITLQPSDSLSTYADVLAAFGYKIELLPSSHALKDLPPERPAVLYALKDVKDDDDKGLTSYAGPRLAVGRKFLVNIVPTKDDRVKHFGELAEESRGAPYLGVLRMDMDSLGRIFSIGLGNLATLSRTSTLSFLVSLFFEGWTERIAQEIGGSRIYTVYSGGDDLFFVGSWDAVVDLAQQIRRDLREFTGRDDLGISGGIVLVHEKYPLYVAAEDADKAEKKAKGVKRRGGREKDAIAFLGIALPWEEFGFGKEDGTAAAWAKRLEKLVEENRIPRTVLGKIQTFYVRYLREREHRGGYGPWIWHAAYWLSRMLERVPKEDRESRGALEELREALSGEAFAQNIDRLALAARWAELVTRRKG